MDGTEYTVELFTSKLTSKKKLIINGACQFDDKIPKGEFMHQFKLKGIACIIASFGDDFELSVKGVRF